MAGNASAAPGADGVAACGEGIMGVLTNQWTGRAWAALELLLAPTARLIPAWGAAPGKGKEKMGGLKVRSIILYQYRAIVAFTPNDETGYQPSHFLVCRFQGRCPWLG
jgi:hypothetical protein